MASPRYSLSKYSLQAVNDDNVIDLRMFADAKFNAVVGFSTDANLSFVAGVTLYGDATLTPAYYEYFDVSEELFANIDIHAGVNIDVDAVADLYATTNWSKVYIRSVLTDKDDVYLDMSAVDMNSIITGDASVRANCYLHYEFTDVLDGHISSVTLEQETFVANVTIPAGGRLVIDSNLFTMLLNNANAIHLQRGDWVELDRKLVHIDINAGTGGTLRGSIIYQARYL